MTTEKQPPPQTPRKPGRPSRGADGVRLSTWVPARTFDALSRHARKTGISLSALLRENLQRYPPK